MLLLWLIRAFASMASPRILTLILVLFLGLSSVGAQWTKTNPNVEYEHFFNHGGKKVKDVTSGKLENEVHKSKVEVLGEVLKRRVQALRNVRDQKVELVFLVDSSASVGADNFFNELKFVKKLLADFTVAYEAARVAVVTFSSKNRVVRHIDHLTDPSPGKHKCLLLEQELPSINYTGGGTYTLGAMLEAQSVLDYARPDAAKAVFLVTDGYSNGGDPRPAAKRLREQGVEIFTFGIRNGNVKELFDMASEPQQEHSFIVDSFEEFEALARRALHEDLHAGKYLMQNRTSCRRLCKESGECCHPIAECTCGTHTGHYACVCPPGHYGTGVKDDCHPCPGGTYRPEGGPGDLRSCIPCPDENHISELGSTSAEQCVCQRGYIEEGKTCRLMACPRLDPPKNGYFVKNVCNSVFNAACGIRCNAGYKLVGSSIRLCQENGTWSGEEAECVMRSCGDIKAPKHGQMNCTQDDYVIDTECEFSCDPGFSLVGSKKRSCLPIGYWDGLPAFCKPVFCSPLPKLLNGTVSPAKCTQAKSRYAEECQASCNDGFELRGPSLRKCSDSGQWSEEDSKTRCVDITPPTVQCPDHVTVEALTNENFALVSWTPPVGSDNSGYLPDITSLPAVTEMPMKFRIGTSQVTYVAHDRRGNKAECTFNVTVLDTQPPTVDQCESPPTYLLRDKKIEIKWEEPIFSDNSGKLVTVQRSRDPGVFPLGDTEILYTAWDESGNNNTCRLVISVKEHACQLPVDPIHGQANCTQKPEAIYCSLTCHDGYAFALPPPQDYFCAYDGQWLPSGNPLPFPDCSITTHSNAVRQDGVIRVGVEPHACEDPFLMIQMESQLKKRLAARLNEICGDNMICEVNDFQAECRNIMAEEEDDLSDSDHWTNSNEIPRAKRHAVDESEDQVTIRPGPSTEKTTRNATLFMRFKVTGRIDNERNVSTVSSDVLSSDDEEGQKKLLTGMKSLKSLLTEAALAGQFDIHYGGRQMSVFAVQFASEEPQFTCPPGSVGQGQQCVLCPVGTFFNVVSEVCEPCNLGSYQPSEGQLSCLVCPQNTSTKITNAKSSEQCQAMCLPGSFSASGLEPCITCPLGTYQSEYAKNDCVPCPEGSTTWRRGSRRVDDCKAVCPRGYVSDTGLVPCFPCPIGFYQQNTAQRFCIRCPRAALTARIGATNKTECIREVVSDPFQYKEVEEFSEVELLEVNECFSLPCKNGGICKSLEFGYVCNCQPGFSGMQCEVDIDECVSAPCQNSGSCTDLVNDFKCQCPAGFTGKQCEINIDECISSPCQNGGTCVDRVLGYSCVCADGYAGVNCQNEINECLSEPCQNGGRCFDLVANFTCACQLGWTGSICDETIDECLSEPCQNGATCEDHVGFFTCNCPKGYTGTLCETEIDECESSPCSQGSTCVNQIGSYLCLCPPGIAGSTCNVTLEANYMLSFTSSGKLDYVTWEGLRGRNVTQFTLCAWLNTKDHTNYGTPFSYATDTEPNALTLTDYSGFVIYVAGSKVVTDVTANDGEWHSVCVTWDSSNGEWKIYLDGEVKDLGQGLATNATIPAHGTVILGQEQDIKGGGFSAAESYLGLLYGIELWDFVLPEESIKEMLFSCDIKRGNILTWADFKHGLRGGIRIEDTPFCKGCANPQKPIFGNVGLTKNGSLALAKYSCESGYEVTGTTNVRLCSVHGGWSGAEPQCARISCGYPGYIINGSVLGNSYRYGDTVTYTCQKGFKLDGKSLRTCTETGQWEGLAPTCQLVTCETPGEPANGFITTRQDVFKYGDQISFKCDRGFRLDGSGILTCLDEGQWDDVVPACQPLACSQPPHVEHGYVTNGVSEVEGDDLLALLTPGSILTYACHYGYQLDSKASLLCGHDGLWMGQVPKCVPVTCTAPIEVPHATFNLSDSAARTGTIISYACDEGYEQYGVPSLECNEKGLWQNPANLNSLPVCLPVDCGTPSAPENGEVFAEDQVLGSTATFSCFSGYKLIGPAWRNCLASGQWSGTQPQCVSITCEDPPLIKNGRVTSGTWATGEAVVYECDRGFALSTRELLFCTKDGRWDGPIPSCIPERCPPPSSIDDGFWVSEDGQTEGAVDFYTDARIQYFCLEGYRLIGESLRTCDGSDWEPESHAPSCVKLACPPLSNIDYGTLTVDGFEVGSLASYECDIGYRLQGVVQRECLRNGVWSDGIPSCIQITCQIPPSPENGNVSYESLVYGSKALYYCNEGFVMNGTNHRTCGEDGQWIGGRRKVPLCQPRQCTIPEIIDHGYIVFEGNLQVGSAIQYECGPGYEVIGPVERVCLASGEWTLHEPYCQLIHCPKLPTSIENGIVEGNDTVYASTVSIQCNPGFELLGAGLLTCHEEKDWSDKFPSCRPVKCPHPGILANGKVNKVTDTTASDSYVFRDIVSFSCKKGFQLKGASERHCLEDGTWSGTQPSCVQITCSSPPLPTHGTISTSNKTYDVFTDNHVNAGENVTFTCKEGYKLHGTPVLLCSDNGTWSGEAPVCLPITCGPPPSIEHSIYLSQDKEYLYGEEHVYSCKAGYRVDGPGTVRCSADGRWSLSIPSCVRAVCPELEAPKHGHVTKIYSTVSLEESSLIALNFSCDPGYDLVGSSFLECTSTEEWSDPAPSCIPWPCPAAPIPANGHAVRTTTFSNHIAVTVDCLPGYQLQGSPTLTCGPKGTWLGEVSCIPKECNPVYPKYAVLLSNVSQFKYGDEISLRCEEGYTTNDEVKVRKLKCGPDGSWQGELPVCIPVQCPVLEPPQNGEVFIEEDDSPNAVVARTLARFSCLPGYVLHGPDTLHCQKNGKWSDYPPVCKLITCPEPTPVDKGLVILRGRNVGESVAYRCQPGYHLLGNEQRTCLENGQWSGSDPFCDVVICPVPEPPENGFWDVGGFSPGATIRFECQPGYTLVGSSVLTCLPNKEWSDDPPVCQQVRCPPLRDPDHGEIYLVFWSNENNDPVKNVYTTFHPYKTSAMYKCHTGYQLFGQDKRTCLEDGTWSGQDSHCQRIWCPEPLAPEFGFVMGSGRQYGDKVRFACSFGHRLIGNDEAFCESSGEWSAATPKCEALTCNSPQPIPDAVLPLDYQQNDRFPVGTRIQWECRDGFSSRGDLSIQCMANQQWTLVSGECEKVRTCPRPAIQGGGVVLGLGGALARSGTFKVGERIFVSCPPGRKNKASATLICLNDGTWSGTPPQCESPCQVPCMNGGVCLPNKKCSCPPGYSGDRCQHAHCILPCLYGGTCIAPYRCACRPGHTGSRCEKPICDPPCSHGGRCVAPNTCHCPPGVSGHACRLKNGLPKKTENVLRIGMN